MGDKPMFSRRHYQAIAAAVRLERDIAVRQAMARLLSMVFAYDNSRFNHKTWAAACGVEERPRLPGESEAGGC